MTTFDMAQKWVPEGCRLEVRKETRAKYICSLFKGEEATVIDIYKTTEPGQAVKHVKQCISTGMSNIYFDLQDWEGAAFWQRRLIDHKSWKKGDLTP